MKRLRVDRWSSQLLAIRSGGAATTTGSLRSLRPEQLCLSTKRQSSSSAAAHEVYDDRTDHQRFPPLQAITKAEASYPSPLPERALTSAKLAALHARLALPERLPLQTLARALVDVSADPNPNFNNATLAFLGHSLISNCVTEYLVCRYPRLPLSIIYAAMKGYCGPETLHHIARQWGIENAAMPGGEVDPGLLQFDARKPGEAMTWLGHRRVETEFIKKFKFRRGISSRVVFDDDFGEELVFPETKEARKQGEEGAEEYEEEEDEVEEPSRMAYGTPDTRQAAINAYANAARAVVGSLYAHAGREAAQGFVRAHVLSRHLDVSKLFSFRVPTRELAMLCAREDFDPPVARLLSETGRLSRTPVYVVGIFSGRDKLGEGFGPSLDYARVKAAINCLKAWYLYSPGENVRVPSDMLARGAKPWTPPYIDVGEIISQ